MQEDLVYKFGPFVLDIHRNRLLRAGEVLHLRRKSYEILVLLVQNAGEMVHKDYLISKVWVETHVEDNNLTQQIYRLRQVLGDTPKDQNFILTVPGKGYIFNKQVTLETIDEPSLPVEESTVDSSDQFDSSNIPDTTITEQSATPSGRVPGKIHPSVTTLVIALGIIILALIGYLTYKAYFVRPYGSDGKVARFIPFATMPGIESYPKFSPDGKFLAFTSEGQSDYNIDVYIKLVNQGEFLRITTSPAEDTNPVWSPDGRHLAILRKSRRYDEKFKLILIPAFGGQEQEIAEVEGGLDWSPDGKFIAVSNGETPASPKAIQLISVDGREKRAISNPPAMEWIYDTTPAFSPDSTQVAFVRWNNAASSDLFVVNLLNGLVKQLTYDGKQILSPRWSRDGKNILFVSSRVDSQRLWQIPHRGGEPSLISSVPLEISQFDISPDGEILAYTQSINDTSISVESLASNSLNRSSHPCSINASRTDDSPQFSPDGKQLVFTSNRTGWDELWISNADCSEIRQLTTFQETGIGSPIWSPDGTRIAFDRHKSEQSQIYTVNTDGKTVVQLTNHGEGACMPSWSADGKWVYYTRYTKGLNQIWKTLADPSPNSAPVQVTVDQGRNGFESADSRFLYYTKSDRIWRKDLISGNESIVSELSDFPIARYWYLSTDSIYFVSENNNASIVVNRFNLNTKKIEEIRRLAGYRSRWTPGLAVSPDQKYLAVSFITYRTGDVTLIEHWR